jgi:hypothetical protein
VLEALNAALAGLVLKPEDSAAVALARLYAAKLDGEDADLSKFGPLLLSVLDSLGMTARSRAAILGKGAGPRDSGPESKADELRKRREKRNAAG